MQNEKFPLISLIVLFYKQGQYVRETLEGAFSQDYPNLEIVISDDNSPDETFEVIQDVLKGYKGKHKIKLNRNEINLGLIDHLNKICMHIAQGQYYVMNGGDDISVSTRCSDVFRLFSSDRHIKFVYGSYYSMSESGEILKELSWAKKKINNTMMAIKDYQGFTGAACSYHRDVFDCFGPITFSTIEDRTLIFRSMLLGKGIISDSFHVKYRLGGMTNMNGLSPKQYASMRLDWMLKHHLGAYSQLMEDIKKPFVKNGITKIDLINHCKKRIYMLDQLDVLKKYDDSALNTLKFIINFYKRGNVKEENKIIHLLLLSKIPNFLTLPLNKIRRFIKAIVKND
ncbi:glycosyltransferase family 2 protein [Vibrio breoganii]